MAAAPEYDLSLNLGDMIGYGASPNQVLEIVRGFHGVVIRGNHDKACVGITAPNALGFNPVANQAVKWTSQALNDWNREWVRKLAAGPIEVPGYPGGVCVHGSPMDEDDYLLSTTAASEAFRQSTFPLVFFGHTHIQGGYVFRRGLVEIIRPKYSSLQGEDRWELTLHPEARYFINPGSIGQPRDGDWRCAFALFDSDAKRITYYRVPYPVEMAQQKIFSADLPEYLALRLRQGR